MSSAAESFEAAKRHLLSRLAETEAGTEPFRHLFVEHVFPAAMYEGLRERMLHYKRGELQERKQDSAVFVNRRYSLVDCQDPEVACLRGVFADPEVKTAFLERFYLNATADLEQSLKIHEEFEFIYTAAGRFQNIHLDIPPKFLSFVFYLPERSVTSEEEERNATVLYDRDLRPRYAARFRPNSVCVFAPHFYSYDGFASTIARDVLVMFYISERERENWALARRHDQPPFESIREAIEGKLQRYPLIEYGTDRARIALERGRCLVNAPQGRVMRDESGVAPPPSAGSAETNR